MYCVSFWSSRVGLAVSRRGLLFFLDPFSCVWLLVLWALGPFRFFRQKTLSTDPVFLKVFFSTTISPPFRLEGALCRWRVKMTVSVAARPPILPPRCGSVIFFCFDSNITLLFQKAVHNRDA
ncbi:hypothetical protein RJT34_14400 [Clitoria ternatea]|uniref:Uncharacterized protein n=1 Tax=Clitoria ternatea TaxID=43366 RepID=A0AAN9JSW9_CLITE